MRDIFYMLKWKNNLDTKDIIVKLRANNYLPRKLACPSCRSDMVMHKDSSRKDSFRWVCKNCRKRKPIRINTWASKYKIPFTVLYMLVRYYVEDYDPGTVSLRVELDESVVVAFFRDLDNLRHIFVSKMCKMIDEDVPSTEIRMLLAQKGGNFRTLAEVFSLSHVFEIVLESLNESF